MAEKVTVKSGQTLSSIAKANNTTVTALKNANPVLTTNPKYQGGNVIFSGTKLNLPTGATGKPTGGTTGGAVDTPQTVGMTPEQVQAMLDEQTRKLQQAADTEKAAAAATAAAAEKKRQVDSIAAISALLSSYGIGDLSTAITDAVIKGYSADTIELMMQDPKGTDPLAVAFQTRFPANKARLAAGKAVLNPAEYLAAERSYAQVLQSYGVGSLATREKMNAFITNDVSATEVADRVGIAVNRVKNADAATKEALALYYPMLNQSDIIGAVLDPAEGLPALQRKVQIAEIGGAALAQGLKTVDAAGKLTSIDIKMGQEALANLGVTKEQARAGFQQVAEVTPRAEFLSSISTGEDYKQLQAEQEAFQGLASAKRARLSLTEQEKARFGGASGMSKASLSQATKGAF
jgi:murein DD-endopeptidase MepM/ murein hydrolase activator NlpD